MILKPIHLYFDKLVNGNPQCNGLVPGYETIKKSTRPRTKSNTRIIPLIVRVLGSINIDYKVLSIADIYNQSDDCHNVFVVEPRHFTRPIDKNIFEHISDITKEHIRNGKIHLLIYYPNEAFPVDQEFFKSELLHPIVNSAKLENFPVDNISMIYGDLNVAENYAKIDEAETRGFNGIFPFQYWELHHRRHVSCLPKESISAEQQISTETRPNKFLCFNGAARNHRLIVVSELMRRNIIDQGLVSMVGKYNTESQIQMKSEWPYEYFDKTAPIELEMARYLSDYLQNWEPKYLDVNSDELLADDRQFDKNLYLDTCFSVVTETQMADGVLFLTEKTFKPIMNLHPFIIIGSHGTLAYLRSIGYETFPEIFNESYDNEPDEKKRLLMVLDEIERLCTQYTLEGIGKLYKRVWPKLIHNRNLFLTRDHTPEHRDVFENIFK